MNWVETSRQRARRVSAPSAAEDRPHRWILALIVSLVFGASARGADPQPYRVDLASTGQGTLDATLRAASTLVALRAGAPVGPFGLIARARNDVDRLKTVLESYGYYQSSVTVRIEGMALNDPGLGDALDALPKKQDARVTVAFVLGPLYHLREVKLDGALPPEAAGLLDLKSGAPAVASVVLGAGARLLSQLQNRGYAFAKVDAPVAYEDVKEPLLDVSFHVETGPKVNVGAIHVQGLHRVHESLVRRRLLLHTGQLYDARAVERARQDLLKTGLFSTASVRVGSVVDETGGVPLTFELAERRRHSLGFNGAYSTDLGGSVGVNWSDRDLIGNGEQLVVSASGLNLGGGDTTGVGYDTTITFIKPDFGQRDQQLQVAVGAVRQFLIAYDQTAITTSVSLNRKLSSVWSASAGVATAEEEILQAGVHYDYTLIGLPLGVSYDSTDLASPLDDPTHGMRNSFSITPTRSLGHPSADFLITQVKLSAYLDLAHLLGSAPGRSVIATRALGGVAQGAGEYGLPPDQRFYGGGSGTIRGYPYQAVGPQQLYPLPVCSVKSGVEQCSPSTEFPIGGTSILAGSIELRQRIVGAWGAAVFLDGGRVRSPLTVVPGLSGVPGKFYVGAGVGLRYYTPIGPIRLDVAVPTRIYTVDGARFQVYVGLGQAF